MEGEKLCNLHRFTENSLAYSDLDQIFFIYYYTGQAAQLIMPRGLDLSQTITITVNYILK